MTNPEQIADALSFLWALLEVFNEETAEILAMNQGTTEERERLAKTRGLLTEAVRMVRAAGKELRVG